MTLGEIAAAAGLPARTIRFYIARGLLNGPVKGGRGAAYTTEHLARLDRIKSLQSDEERPLEVIYSFPLPRDAALRRFRITGDGFETHSERDRRGRESLRTGH